MVSQRELIHGSDWDTLIVLDACRYDAFKEAHGRYLGKGELRKVRSDGSSTGEWLFRTFPKRYDLTYISTNPYVNSYGIPLAKCNPEYPYDWNAREHFTRIIDAWDLRWNDELETVMPGDVNELYLSLEDKDRTIIHYMQPHLPYLSLGALGSFSTMKRRAGSEKEDRDALKEAIDKVMVVVEDNLKRYIGTENLWKVKRNLHIRSRSGYESAWRAAGGTERLMYYYKDNLKIVLKSVSELLEHLEGKTVITADHGEAFGENDVWFHADGKSETILLEVPWYEIVR